MTGRGGVPLAGVVDTYLSGHGFVASTRVDATGDYLVTGLPSGIYKVKFRTISGYAGEWYDEKADFESATTVPVTAGTTTAGIDTVLEREGSITGTVMGTTGGPLANADVEVFTLDQNRGGSGRTNDSGVYSVSLPAGTYKVRFSNGDAYSAQWYDDTSSFAAATEVVVSAGIAAAGVNAALKPSGGISGRVTGSDGVALADLKVFAEGDMGDRRSARTDPTGAYSFTGLSAGAYKIQFISHDNSYLREWYDDKPDAASATEVTVNAGATTTAIDAVLARAGIIAGTVTGVVGTALRGAYVEACLFGTTRCTSAGTRMSGEYAITGLAAGAYTVYFAGAKGYLDEWYDNKPDLALSTRVTVTAGRRTAGIDAVLEEVDFVLWTRSDTGKAVLWKVDPKTGALRRWSWISTREGAGAGWEATSYVRGDAWRDYVLWTNRSTGQAIRWAVDPVWASIFYWEWISPKKGVGAGWQASSYVRGDGTTDYVLWTNSARGQAIRWEIDFLTGGRKGVTWISPATGVGKGWEASSYERGDDKKDYVLWTKKSTGQAIRWKVDPTTGARRAWVWISPPEGVGSGWEASCYERVDATTHRVLWTHDASGLAVRWQLEGSTGLLKGWDMISTATDAGAGWRATGYVEAGMIGGPLTVDGSQHAEPESGADDAPDLFPVKADEGAQAQFDEE